MSNPLSDADATLLVMDQTLYGVAVTETVWENYPDKGTVPVRVERVPPDQWVRFVGAEDRGGGKTSMRQAVALHMQKEIALHQWRNFNEVYGYGPGWTVKTSRTPKRRPRLYRLKRRWLGAKRRARR